MALLDNLFSKKMPVKAASGEESDRGPSDSQPSYPSVVGLAADRKNMRLERRELLYAVVRESMARVGMLSSSYKYKVLSLDPRGRQYLIMMDFPQELAAQTGRLAEIESIVTQNAKARHDIVVKAVYWRINGPVPSAVLRQSRTTSEGDVPGRPAGRVEPIREDELAAFKNALAGGASIEAPAKPIAAWRRNPARQADFADTQVQEQAGKKTKAAVGGRDFQDTDAVESVEKTSPLSGTQYGDLN